MPEQLIYLDPFYLYLNAGPRATPHWVGSASGTGLRDSESRDPVPDPETFPFRNCGLPIRGRPFDILGGGGGGGGLGYFPKQFPVSGFERKK